MRDVARKESVRLRTDMILDVISVAEAIMEYGIHEDVDLIVMGTRGRTGLKRSLVGSVANGVVLYAHCPVLFVK